MLLPNPHPRSPRIPLPVQDWPELAPTAASTYPTILSLMHVAPNHVILPQHLAQAMHYTMKGVIMFNPPIADKLWKDAFTRWAWNLTPQGELKSVPSLGEEERVVWEGYVKEMRRG
ncbi:hypothetical protein HBI38_155720 [Parastagonospora nodorum]|nr:hypothetical protein HBI10_150790 [Parastagonospora nodorum]KAH4009167.1 hypothetical protein HBI13_224860 [Parastagonospora nodorum]KAH4894770.1 hypothetical protein HBH74_195370 [Parastagonospora nodorum]KAH4933249.1 hypothetical protein HBH73_183980 [Parastagonospora nodorum]KAH4962678.1 hypothetical protein HBI78_129970 [Parastagonospora nodorum]